MVLCDDRGVITDSLIRSKIVKSRINVKESRFNMPELELNLSKNLLTEIIISEDIDEISVIFSSPKSVDSRYLKEYGIAMKDGTNLSLEVKVERWLPYLLEMIDGHCSELERECKFKVRVCCSEEQKIKFINHLHHGILCKLKSAENAKNQDLSCDDVVPKED